MTDEIKSLIEDAAKLLGLPELEGTGLTISVFTADDGYCFDPCDPDRGDLMKVWLALPECTMGNGFMDVDELGTWCYKQGDYQSLALAILRAASAVLKARGA